jgi:hypothetical protein
MMLRWRILLPHEMEDKDLCRRAVQVRRSEHYIENCVLEYRIDNTMPWRYVDMEY